MDSMVSELAERVSRAERQVSVLRGLLLAFVAGVVLLSTARPARTQSVQPAVVVTQGQQAQGSTTMRAPFQVVDEQGRAFLTVSGRTLKMYSRTGTEVIRLDASYVGGSVSCNDSTGQKFMLGH